MINLKSNKILIFALLSLLIALAAGCGSSKHIWGNPDTGLILSYRFPSNTPYTYKMNVNQNQTMEMMGNTRETKTNFTIQYTLTCSDMKDKDYSLSVKLDSLSLTIDAAGMPMNKKPDLSQLTGKTFGILLTPKGEEKEIIGADSITYALGMGQTQSIKNQFTSMFPNLPDYPVKVGDAWSDTTDNTLEQSGMTIEINMILKNVVEGFETVNGKKCVKIKTTGTGTMDGSGQSNGVDITMESDMETETVWYFAYKTGTYIKQHSSRTTEGTVSITGAANMTIPLSGETITDVQLVK